MLASSSFLFTSTSGVYLLKGIDLPIFTRRNIWLRNGLSLAVTLASFAALHLLPKSHLARYYNFSRPPLVFLAPPYPLNRGLLTYDYNYYHYL